MPRITINGKELAFEGKKMVLQVALENAVEIPYYCFHPGLSIVASCRICLAEIEQPDPKTGKLVLQPKLFPTCQTPASDGMVVHTESPKSIANQKAVMEYLLINHPLDCPVCDQAGECYLQDYSYQYGRAQSRFQEDKIKQPTKDIGPHVKLYADRCIMCSRCVRFTKEITGTGELGVFGRGSAEQIDIFPGKPLDNDLSGNVVDICPVGALLDKDFLFAQRVWFLQQAASIDGITASGDNIWVHHNEGRVFRVKPRTNLELNKWWISDEVRYGWKYVHSPERLTSPRRVQYGVQVDCDWARAYEDIREAIARTLDEKGPGSIAVMVSPMLSCEEAYLLGKLARGVDASAVLAVGPIPVTGQDKTFPGGYTVRAEKCPNSRGVRRAIESLGGGAVLAYEEFIKSLTDKATKVGLVIVTGQYPSAWTTKELSSALSKKFVVAIDVLPNDVAAKAGVLLPGATWVETAGCFENAAGRLQSFEQAIPPLEGTRSVGQIALDLAAVCEIGAANRFDAPAIRTQLGGPFASNVRHPSAHHLGQPDMQYVEL